MSTEFHDIGCRTDVLDGCNKLTGVYMAVRSLSPQVVAMDEIGGEDDIKAVKYCIKSGQGCNRNCTWKRYI